MTLVALLLWGVPAAFRQYQWRENVSQIRTAFEKAATENLDTSISICIEFDRQRWLLTNDVDKANQAGFEEFSAVGSNETTIQEQSLSGEFATKRLRKALFVLPPGEWASTPDEALQLLKDHL